MILFVVQQKLTQHCKAIILQLKEKNHCSLGSESMSGFLIDLAVGEHHQQGIRGGRRGVCPPGSIPGWEVSPLTAALLHPNPNLKGMGGHQFRPGTFFPTAPAV